MKFSVKLFTIAFMALFFFSFQTAVFGQKRLSNKELLAKVDSLEKKLEGAKQDAQLANLAMNLTRDTLEKTRDTLQQANSKTHFIESDLFRIKNSLQKLQRITQANTPDKERLFWNEDYYFARKAIVQKDEKVIAIELFSFGIKPEHGSLRIYSLYTDSTMGFLDPETLTEDRFYPIEYAVEAKKLLMELKAVKKAGYDVSLWPAHLFQE
jgi:hypothetical protein